MLLQGVTHTDKPTPRVFIVDDDDAVRAAVTMLILSFGWQVESFPSAEAFLNSYHRGVKGCLVLDLRMPGMNGVELQQRLTAEGIDLPVVMITAHKDDPLTAQALKAGVLDILPKPFKDEDLLRSVTDALSKIH